MKYGIYDADASSVLRFQHFSLSACQLFLLPLFPARWATLERPEPQPRVLPLFA
jgi:hypothetical protein